MLNFNLQQLCGPKCNDLKVRNPAKYGWEPRRLLGQIFDIYLHLDCDRFATALAADERSFEKHLFDDAAARIERLCIRSTVQVEKFRALLTKAHDIYGKYKFYVYNFLVVDLYQQHSLNSAALSVGSI